MYETYVPITETIVVRKPPTIAEIVRQKTDDGARIIDFFLDLMEGRVEDAKLCHRIDAAKQLVKYGSKKAADFIAEHGDETCDHCESRKRGPRPRKDQSPPAGPPYAAPHLTPDFLTLLTEDFLTVVSAVDEDLMIKLVRAQTRDGGTVVDFLDDVMEGRNARFKPNHRISAARELISHILRDEHLFAQTVVPAHPIVVPAESPPHIRYGAGTQRNGKGRSEHVEVSAHPEHVLSTAAEPKIVRPEHVLSTAEGLVEEPALSSPKGQCSGDSNPSVVPAKAGFLPQEPSPTQGRQRGRQPRSQLRPYRRNPNRRSGESRNPEGWRSRGGQGRNTRTGGAHPRRAQGQGRARPQRTARSPTHGQDPSTPQPRAARRPGNRDPATQLNIESLPLSLERAGVRVNLPRAPAML